MAHVLIMEDDLTLRFELSEGLRAEGHEVETVGSADEAMDALKSDHFDILITDIYVHRNGRVVPEGGVSLIGWVRTYLYRAGPLSRLGSLPIIAMSGAADTSGKQYVLHMAKNIGATLTLRKPLSIQELNLHINELTKSTATGT